MSKSKVNLFDYLFSVLKRQKAYFVPLVLFFGCGAAWIILMEHGLMVLLLNDRHVFLADRFFYYFTELGNGLTFAIASVLWMIFGSYRAGLFSLSTFALSALLAQFFKRVVFSDRLRPFGVFKDMDGINLIEGMATHSLHSFPSGHTASAFAMCLVAALIFRNQGFAFFFSLLAILVAISRVYLFQHFFVDVYGGALLGTASALLMGFAFTKWFTPQRYPWLKNSVLKSLGRG